MLRLSETIARGHHIIIHRLTSWIFVNEKMFSSDIHEFTTRLPLPQASTMHASLDYCGCCSTYMYAMAFLSVSCTGYHLVLVLLRRSNDRGDYIDSLRVCVADLVEEDHVVACFPSFCRGDNIGAIEGCSFWIQRKNALLFWKVKPARRVHQLRSPRIQTSGHVSASSDY